MEHGALQCEDVEFGSDVPKQVPGKLGVTSRNLGPYTYIHEFVYTVYIYINLCIINRYIYICVYIYMYMMEYLQCLCTYIFF